MGFGNEFNIVIGLSEHLCTNKVWIRFANMVSYHFRIYGDDGGNGKLTDVSYKMVSTQVSILKMYVILTRLQALLKLRRGSAPPSRVSDWHQTSEL